MSDALVYVLSESAPDCHSIVAIYETKEAAEREAAYCRAMQKRYNRGGLHMDYTVTPYALGASTAGLLVRFTRSAVAKDVDFFSGGALTMSPGEVREYDIEWPNGVCADAYARSVEDATSLFRAHQDTRQ